MHKKVQAGGTAWPIDLSLQCYSLTLSVQGSGQGVLELMSMLNISGLNCDLDHYPRQIENTSVVWCVWGSGEGRYFQKVATGMKHA